MTRSLPLLVLTLSPALRAYILFGIVIPGLRSLGLAHPGATNMPRLRLWLSHTFHLALFE